MRQPQQQQQQQESGGELLGRAAKRRTQQPHYDELIGAIDQGTSSTRFLAFEKGTGRLVASSQIEIKRITPREGWVEIDPDSIMASVYATMANVHEQLLTKQHQLTTNHDQALCDTSFLMNGTNDNSPKGLPRQAGPTMLKCIGICNQRESAVVWDSKSGQPLYNVLVWMDNRTKDIVDNMIDSIPGRDFNHLKDKTGLPMSTYFSAFKLRWLIENVPQVYAALKEKRLLVGTVDSWILWNLTGRHLTDVTNASRTFLMDIETLQWDKQLCDQFKVPMEILPKILSSADDFGQLQFGPFMGTPVTGVIGDQSAALFGHNCLQLGQTKATFGTGCFIMQNIGPGPLNGALSGVQREAKRGLITTVGFKLKDKPACYALEGSIKIAGAALTWLRDNIQLIENYEECDQLVNATTHSAGVFFVPALGGLYSPYWDPNAAGLFIGLSQFTRREHLVRATFDSIAFQTNDILSLMHGVANGLMIDGGLCKSDNLCQILADITGCDIVRPSMCETSALGAAMVAGCGAGIWDYDRMLASSNTPFDHACSTNKTHHYPHESLHYDNKFSSLIQTRLVEGAADQATTATFDESNECKRQLQDPYNNEPASQQRDGGHLMRIDSGGGGGGVNDDAGGGDGSGGGNGIERGQNLTTNDDDQALDTRYTGNPSKEAHVAESGAADLGGVVPPLGELIVTSNAPLPPLIEGQTMESSFELSSESSELRDDILTVSANLETTGAANSHAGRTLVSLISNLSQQDGAPASSSGYSSSDNFESATTNSLSALTDSVRLPGATRIDSPVSQATNADAPSASGCNSVATFTDYLINDKSNQIGSISNASCGPDPLLLSSRSSSSTTSSAKCPTKGSASARNAGKQRQRPRSPKINAPTMDSYATGDKLQQERAYTGRAFPFNLTSYISQQRESTTYAINKLFVNRLHMSPPPLAPSAQGSSAIRPASRQCGATAQAKNNRKFVANAEDVADEVHEFGGRDSYGEDGYDSSTISFDSYEDEIDDDDDDLEIGSIGCDIDTCDQIRDDDVYDVAYYVDDNEEVHGHGRDKKPQEEYVIKPTDNDQTHHHKHGSQAHHQTRGASEESNEMPNKGGNARPHRRRHTSLLEKQMDVFQPYISLEHRTELVNTWRLAVHRSMQWTKVHHEEIRRIDYQRLSSLPISMYVFFSVGMVALSGFLSSTSDL